MSLERRIPLAKVAKKPRRHADLTCSIRTCHYPPRIFQWCAKHARKEADKLFAKVVKRRDRYCQNCGTPDNPECAHVFGRGYFATRWDLANAVQLCAGDHVWFTHNPIEWEDWCIERMGREPWEELRAKAKHGGMPPLEIVIPELRALLEDAA